MEGIYKKFTLTLKVLSFVHENNMVTQKYARTYEAISVIGYVKAFD